LPDIVATHDELIRLGQGQALKQWQLGGQAMIRRDLFGQAGQAQSDSGTNTAKGSYEPESHAT
jgi:hypothetical protein